MLGDATNTQRPVKRLRLKDADADGEDGQENRLTRYFTTLRDQAQEIPRSELLRNLVKCRYGED